jgi:acyl carrier protein
MRSAVRYGSDLVIGEVSADGVSATEHAPPPLLDAATHGLAMLVADGHRYVSVGIDEVRVFRKPRGSALVSVLRRNPVEAGDIAFTVDVLLLADDRPVAELRGMAFRRLTTAPPAVAALTKAANGNGTVRDVIRATVADALRIDDPADIDVHATFLELGLDSLVGLKVKAALELRYAVTLRDSVVFDHPTTAALAAFLDGRIRVDAGHEHE